MKHSARIIALASIIPIVAATACREKETGASWYYDDTIVVQLVPDCIADHPIAVCGCLARQIYEEMDYPLPPVEPQQGSMHEWPGAEDSLVGGALASCQQAAQALGVENVSARR